MILTKHITAWNETNTFKWQNKRAEYKCKALWDMICYNYTVSQKKQGTTILSITSPNVDHFQTSFTVRFIRKFATKT